MSEAPPLLLVVGATEDAPPPRIQAAADRVQLAYAGTPEAVAQVIAGAAVIFAWRPSSDLLEGGWARANGVRWMQSASAGVDGLLFPALVESDVVVTNARGVFDEGMAEYTIGLMLAFAKDLPTTIRHSRDGVWESRYTERLSGRRLLVVGAGSIGTAVARKARALGMRVEGVARSARPPDETFERVVATASALESLPLADFVVNALPLTPETRGLFDDRAFAAMRPSARFVNLGRGPTVDQDAIVRALEGNRIAGAALDVFDEEPLPADSPLWGMSNVIVSPHMSGDLMGWEGAVVELFLSNLDRWLRGERLRNVVDKRLGYPAGA